MTNESLLNCILIENDNLNTKYFDFTNNCLTCNKLSYYNDLVEVCNVISDNLIIKKTDELIYITYTKND